VTIRNNKRQSLQHSVVALLLHGKEMRYGNFREMTDFNVRRSGGLLARPRIKKYVEFYIASYTLFLFIYPWAHPTQRRVGDTAAAHVVCASHVSHSH
jgi:hypothetical protein